MSDPEPFDRTLEQPGDANIDPADSSDLPAKSQKTTRENLPGSRTVQENTVCEGDQKGDRPDGPDPKTIAPFGSIEMSQSIDEFPSIDQFQSVDGTDDATLLLEQPDFLATQRVDGTIQSAANQPSKSHSSSHKVHARRGGKSKPVSVDETLPDYVGKFRIKSELGRGAFGVVYLGYDEELLREVAIKVSLVADPVRQEKLKVEAARAAQVESTGIVPVYHIGTTEKGAVYFVQKFIKGQTLRDLIRHRPLSPMNAVTLMHSIAKALVPAHQQDILHRDLKPDNILIDGEGQPWIADFGLAISESEQTEGKRELAGTPPYMSPEQIRGRIDFLDQRSDIWALGVIFYESLTGKLPFKGKTREAITDQICERDPKPLQQYAEGWLSNEVSDLFRRACAKQPSDRFPTTMEFTAALEALLATELSDHNLNGEADAELSLVGGSLAYSYNRSTLTASQNASFASRADSNQSSAQPLPSAFGWIQKLAGVALVVGLSLLASIGYQRFSAEQPKSADSSAEVLLKEGGLREEGDLDNSSRRSLEPHRSEVLSDSSTLPLADSDEPALGETAPSEDQEGLADSELMKDKNTDTEPEPVPLPEGTQDDPMVVAADGTGSHITIAQAILDAPDEGFISINPGVYEESLTITRPVTIMGPPLVDEEQTCEIMSTDGPAITAICSDGLVKLRRCLVNGRGSKMTSEFNAIEVQAGTFVIENSAVTTSSFNCVKVKNQANFGASDCRFLESKKIAVSGKDHKLIVIQNCSFKGSGLEAVGGPAKITKSLFYGDRGVTGENTKGVIEIQDCEFRSSRTHSVVALAGAEMSIANSRFEECDNALRVDGGTITTKDQCVISDSTIAVRVSQGTLELSDTQILNTITRAVAVAGPADISLDGCEINGAGVGVDQGFGTLNINGGKISNCRTAPLNIKPFETTLKEGKGLKFEGMVQNCILESSSSLIAISHGDLELSNLRLLGSGVIGIFAETVDPSLAITLHAKSPIEFAGSFQVPVFAKGNVTLDFDEKTKKSVLTNSRVIPPAAFQP